MEGENKLSKMKKEFTEEQRKNLKGAGTVDCFVCKGDRKDKGGNYTKLIY